MSASISVSGSAWTLDVSDTSRSWTFSIPISWSGGAQSSAEWIIERPALGAGHQLASLTDFHSTSFASASATDAGSSGPISSFNFDPLEMTNAQNDPLSVPGPLDPTGASFDESWLAGS
jgi:hypothetical protein